VAKRTKRQSNPLCPTSPEKPPWSQGPRAASPPSITVWHRRLGALGPTWDVHLETQRARCARLMDRRRMGRHNPLIEVVAE